MGDNGAGDTGTLELDMDKAVGDVASAVFPPHEADTEVEEPVETTEPEPATAGPVVDAKQQVTPVTDKSADTTTPAARPAPKSWPKEMHEHWGKTPQEVQTYWETREKQMLDGIEQYKSGAEFGKTLRDIITPYKPILQAAGLDEATAVGTLLNAHYRLTQGSQESRKAAYEQLGKNLGLIAADPNAPVTPVDPKFQALEEQLNLIQSTLTASQQAAYQEQSKKVSQEVEAFASDTKAHPYFEECSDHIVKLIRAGYSLQDAYDTAVMANPVTKAKEVARIQTEHEAKLKENARLNALPKQKAAGVNVKGKETRTAPTGPKGSMEDTLRETMKQIQGRTA